jgi:O-antigen/teichoic acid export membrane protein
MKLAGNINTIIKNGALFTIAPFLPKIINVFLLPIMTRYLTDVDFGIAGTISAYTGAIGAFSTLGLQVVLQNSFFKTPIEYKDIWRQIYGFLKCWMILFALMQSIILFLFIPEEAEENKWMIIFLSQFSTVLFGPTGTIGNAYYIYTKKSVPVVWRSVTASVLTIIIDFILIVYLRLGYLGWYIGTFAGSFFTNASYWYVVNRNLQLYPDYKFQWQVIKHSLSVALPTVPHYYTTFLLEGSGRLVLDRYNISQAQIGKISISQQMGDIFNHAIQGCNNAISPFQMEALRENNSKRINTIATLFAALVFSAVFMLAIWSKELFYFLLSNESLQSSYNYFILYIMAFCYRPMYLTVSYYYFFYERTKQLLFISFTSGFIAIFLYIILTPFWGVWSFLIGHYISCVFYGYSGYFFKGYREKESNRLRVIWFLFIQLFLTVIAFYIVEFLWVKSLLTLFFIIIVGFIFFKFRHVFKG